MRLFDPPILTPDESITDGELERLAALREFDFLYDHKNPNWSACTSSPSSLAAPKRGGPGRIGDWDVILMDVHMPRMDGIEATQLIRRGEAAANRRRTLIIGLTADAMSDQVGSSNVYRFKRRPPDIEA
jgi:CheY-like chemotaxis protein